MEQTRYTVKTTPEGVEPGVVFNITQGQFEGFGFTVTSISKAGINEETNEGLMNYVYSPHCPENKERLLDSKQFQETVNGIMSSFFDRLVNSLPEKKTDLDTKEGY